MMKFFIFMLLSVFSMSKVEAQETLWEQFCNPHHGARTKVWWFHGETTTTKEGIDADLRAFKEAGLGGVVYYDQTHGSEEGAFASMSPEWWDMLKYAARRAKELGLSFELAASNGYVAGGPWITPDMGMQQVVSAEVPLELPLEEGEVLSLPSFYREGFKDIATFLIPSPASYTPVCIQKERLIVEDCAELIIEYDAGKTVVMSTITYRTNPRGKGSYGSMNLPGKPQERFWGAGYVDFPPIGDLEYSNDGKTWKSAARLLTVENIIGHKSNRRTINFPAVKARYFRVRLHDWTDAASKFCKLEIGDVWLSGRDMIDNWEVKTGLRSEVTYPHATGNNRGALKADDIIDITSLVDDEGHIDINGLRHIKEGKYRMIRIGYIHTGGHTKHGRSRVVWNGKELYAKTWLEADVMNAKAAELHYNSYFKAIYDTLCVIGCPPQGMHMDSHEAGIANWTPEMPTHFKRVAGYDIRPWLVALCGYIIDNRERTEQFLHDFRQTISATISDQFYGTFARLCKRDSVTFTCQAMLGCVNDNIASRGHADKPQGEFWGYQVNGNYDCLDCSSSAHLYGKRVSSAEAFSDSPYFVNDETASQENCISGWHKLLRIANLAYCKGINEFVACSGSYQPWLDRKYDDSKSKHPYIFHRFNPAWPVSRDHFWEYQARCSELLQAGRPIVDLLIYIGEDVPLKTMTYKLPLIPEGYQYDVCTLRSLKESSLFSGSSCCPQYKALIVQDRTYLSPEAEEWFVKLRRHGMTIIRCDKGETIADGLNRAGIEPDITIKSADKPTDKTYFYHRQVKGADIYFVYNHSNHDYVQNIILRSRYKTMEQWNPLSLERKPFNGTLSLKPYGSLFIIAQ
ncbi:glycosyl hydrolase [Bacteroides ilei]|uniref:glycosyl hydrolase n=1 Tax=Bacteroides ilei TaxID=1907658 RepID=UPI00092FE62F|nr:glycosyl hydrolase [Bacteroides ilei]